MADIGARTKRHIIILENREGGSTVIATDYIDEILENPTFAQMMGIDAVERVRVVRRPAVRREVIREAPREVFEEEIFEEQPRTQSQRPVQAPSSGPGPRPPSAQGPPADKSFLKLNPDQMTDLVWSQLSPQQQQEYLTYYGLPGA